MASEHMHDWQWNGYDVISLQTGTLHFLCSCGKKKTQAVSLSDAWFAIEKKRMELTYLFPGYMEPVITQEQASGEGWILLKLMYDILMKYGFRSYQVEAFLAQRKEAGDGR